MILSKSKLTVLMTVHNCQDYVEHSIKSLINQSYNKWKLVVIDDCSTDDTLHIIKKIKDRRIKIYKLRKRIGRTRALNVGLRYCKSKYIAILDADDISYKKRFKIQVKFLENNNNISLVAAWWKAINYKGKIINEVRLPVNDIEVRRKLMLTNIIPHSTVMFKKKILSTVNQYPQNLVYAQDYGFMLKVIKKFNIIIIPQFLCSCRYHKYQMTADKTIQKEKLNDRRILLNWKKKNFKLNTSINLLLLVEKLKILIKEAIFYYKNLIII